MGGPDVLMGIEGRNREGTETCVCCKVKADARSTHRVPKRFQRTCVINFIGTLEALL